MRLLGEIGGATLEGAGSKPLWASLSRYLEKHFKCLEIIVA